MSATASQITGVSIVHSTISSGADQRKHQRSAPLVFLMGIDRWPMNSPHKRPVTWEMLPFDDVIMRYSCKDQPESSVLSLHLRIFSTSGMLVHQSRFDKSCFHQAPVPLSIFRSNSKFDENSKHSSVKYTRPITTIFCTRHDSVTVVTCAKYRCDRSSIIETRAFWIFIEFRIRSKYA